MQLNTLRAFARALEHAVIAVATTACVFRVAAYARFERPAGAHYGPGDLIDFALLALLFVLGLAAAASGLALAARLPAGAQAAAYRPAVVGITAFVVVYLVQPYLPTLGG